MSRIGQWFAVGLFLSCGSMTAANASPWAEVGDAQLRSDIEILAAAGAIDGITTHWPIPWASIISRLRAQGDLAQQPPSVRAAAERLLARAQMEANPGGVHAAITVDGTNAPSFVRGFDGLGRETAIGQLSAEFIGSTTAVRLVAGAELHARTGRVAFVPDGSYIAQKIGGAVIYGGYLDHWWGPGWISAMSLSNNARPMPHVGIARAETTPFSTPWLSWLGPWQLEFMVGLMDDSRIAVNTIYNGLRFTFNPYPGLEIGIARTEQLCGTGHPCVPLKYYFEFANNNSHVNHTNDEGVIDVKYSTVLGNTPFEVYMQLMNEDSSPITHSGTTHLFGSSIWIPTGHEPVRVTLEYADSVPTLDIFSFGNVLHGFSYNNGGYPDGMRYRGRTIGFSLDSDSTLLTLQGAWRDANSWTYELSLHHAAISNPNNQVGNVVTTAPVHINMAEMRLGIPLRHMDIEIAGRLQDDQPRPDHGFQASIEAAITYHL